MIAVSEGIRTAAIQHYQLMSEQVHTIHNGFDFERIQALAAEPAPELKLHEFSVLGIGRLQREKGFDILLDALKRIRERRQADGIRVWLIGAGPEESTLRNLAAENGLAGQVEFVGFQTNPYRWMRHAQLVCLPSRFEGMPNVLVEAMACGVPVVASDCPHGPREILNSGSLGCLVETGDSAALAEAILECRNHYDAAIGRAAVARESVAARFSMQNCISEIQTQLERAARQESS